jgi:hypothetical protein
MVLPNPVNQNSSSFQYIFVNLTNPEDGTKSNYKLEYPDGTNPLFTTLYLRYKLRSVTAGSGKDNNMPLLYFQTPEASRQEVYPWPAMVIDKSQLYPILLEEMPGDMLLSASFSPDRLIGFKSLGNIAPVTLIPTLYIPAGASIDIESMSLECLAAGPDKNRATFTKIA